MSGILITRVNSATRIVNIGSVGGGAREQVAVDMLQLQREALDFTLDGEEVQDAYEVDHKRKSATKMNKVTKHLSKCTHTHQEWTSIRT